MIIDAFDRLCAWARKSKRNEIVLVSGMVLLALLITAGFMFSMEALKGPEQKRMEREWASRREVSLAEVPINTDAVHPPRKASNVLCHTNGYLPKDIKVSEYWPKVVLAVGGSKRVLEGTAIMPNVPATWLGCEEGEEAVIYRFNPFE
jgi:hypothetical protein